MNSRSSRPLSALGINELEERIYQTLLEGGEATLEELAVVLDRAAESLRPALRSLDRLGLVTQSLQQPRQYIPMSPSIALEALIYKRQEELERARAEATLLQMRVRADKSPSEQQIVELITSPEAERRAFEQMERSARDEILFLVRQPLRVSSVSPEQAGTLYQQAQARGVRYRRLADTDFIEQMSARNGLRPLLEQATPSDQLRVTAQLPFKMVLIDRQSALIPLSPDDTDGPVLLVRSRAMLDALYTLFEFLWERSAILQVTEQGAVQSAPNDPLAATEVMPLVQLLATGLNDKLIAGELDISRSTLDRRMLALRESLGARTRFQAGWLAAHRWKALLDDELPP